MTIFNDQVLDDKENPNCQHILWRKLIRYNESFGYQYKE